MKFYMFNGTQVPKVIIYCCQEMRRATHANHIALHNNQLVAGTAIGPQQLWKVPLCPFCGEPNTVRDYDEYFDVDHRAQNWCGRVLTVVIPDPHTPVRAGSTEVVTKTKVIKKTFYTTDETMSNWGELNSNKEIPWDVVSKIPLSAMRPRALKNTTFTAEEFISRKFNVSAIHKFLTANGIKLHASTVAGVVFGIRTILLGIHTNMQKKYHEARVIEVLESTGNIEAAAKLYKIHPITMYEWTCWLRLKLNTGLIQANIPPAKLRS